MKIRVDADASPGPIREIPFRAAERTRVALTLVANQPVRSTPGSRYIVRLSAELSGKSIEMIRI